MQSAGSDDDFLGNENIGRVSTSNRSVAYTDGLLVLEKHLLYLVLCENVVVGTGLDAVVTGDTSTATSLGLRVQDGRYPEDTNVGSRLGVLSGLDAN